MDNDQKTGLVLNLAFVLDAVVILSAATALIWVGRQSSRIDTLITGQEALSAEIRNSNVTDGRIVRIETRLDQITDDMARTRASQERFEAALVRPRK